MTRLIPLSKNGKNRGKFFAIVDDDDFERVNTLTWRVLDNGYTIYAINRKGGKELNMSCFVLNLKNGSIVDHVDGDGLNNTRNNLRPCTRSKNQMNRRKFKNNTSGYKGVSWSKNAKKWLVHIECHHVGVYTDQTEAARAYDLKAIELHGEFARTNFPRSDYEAQA